MSDNARETENTNGSKKIEAVPYLYEGVVIAIAGLFLLTTLLSFFVMQKSLSSYTVTGIGFLYFAGSIVTGKPNEVWAIYIFGKEAYAFRGGLHVVPLFISTIIRVPLMVIEKDHPAPPELIWRDDRDDKAKSDSTPRKNLTKNEIEAGFKPPNRVTFVSAEADGTYPNPTTWNHLPKKLQNDPALAERLGYREDNTQGDPTDPLNLRISAEVPWWSRSSVNPGRVFDFILRFGITPNTTVKEIENEVTRQIEDMGTSLIFEMLSRKTAAQALSELALFTARLEEYLQENTESWGLITHNARINAVGLSHTLNAALQLRAQERARGQAEVEFATGQGEAALKLATGQKAAADMLGITPMDTFAVEVAKEMAKGGKLILGTTGIRDTIVAAQMVADALKRNGDEPSIEAEEG